MDTRTVALVVIAVGVGIVVIGLVMLAGGLSWFGRLPGDIRYESNGTRVYVPITSMILVSIALSLLLFLVRRFL